MSYLGIDSTKFLTPQSANIKRIVKAVLTCKYPSITVSGGLGTSKTASIMWALNCLCSLASDLRVLVLRNAKAEMPTTILPTMKEMLVDGLVVSPRQPFAQVYGGAVRTQTIYYKSGSEMHFGGLDSQKALGVNASIIFLNQAERMPVSAYEDLLARLRGQSEFTNPFTNRKATLMLQDCNPSSPASWILRKRDEGQLKLFDTHLEDNVWFFRDNLWTPSGENYLARLDEAYKQDDYRRARYRFGLWQGAEGRVFESFSEDKHVITMRRTDIPSSWRFVGALDYGIRNPSCFHILAHSPDRKKIWVYKTFLKTGFTSADLIPVIRDLLRKEGLSEKTPIIGDTSSDSNQILKRGGLHVRDAKKDINLGIEILHQFFDEVDGREIRINVNALTHPPHLELINQGKPTDLIQALHAYVHLPEEKRQEGAGIKNDLPFKNGVEDSIDALRYGGVFVARGSSYIPSIIASSSHIPQSGLFAA